MNAKKESKISNLEEDSAEKQNEPLKKEISGEIKSETKLN